MSAKDVGGGCGPGVGTLVRGAPARALRLLGEEISCHVSSDRPTTSLAISRLGATEEVVFKKRGISMKQFPIPENASSHGCRWLTWFRIAVQEDWRSGYYVARFAKDITPD